VSAGEGVRVLYNLLRETRERRAFKQRRYGEGDERRIECGLLLPPGEGLAGFVVLEFREESFGSLEITYSWGLIGAKK